VADGSIEELFNLFELRVDAFAVCRIAPTAALQCDPFDQVVVHFVLSGEGLVKYEGGGYPLCPGTVLVVPRGLGKVLAGRGPIVEYLNASEHCALEHGITRFDAGSGEPGLVLGCAAIKATIGGVIDVFEHLWEPMLEDAAGTSIQPVLSLIEGELASPGVGTRTIVSDLMKHVLIAAFRGQLSREAYRSWLWPGMMNRQLGRAAMAVMARPQDPHCVESLASLAGLSRSRFTELFTESFGRSPIEFLHAVRLRAAHRLLLSSSLPVKSVAAEAGFASRSHFCRAFQAKYGEAPSAFRMREKRGA
jgi:AraC-like DNA-binding protein